MVQLGTPDAPEKAAVRRYLKSFLSDPRVVEIPRLLWWPLLNGVILNTRPAKSAERYRAIWTRDGSPLMTISRRQRALLKGSLGEAGLDVEVALAMRYGNPSVGAALQALRARNLARLLVLPMYPQYAASTTASVFDAVAAELSTWRNLPELRFVRNFHDHPGWLDAQVRAIESVWQADGRPDRLVMSFHGVPRRSLDLGDPYHCECLATGRRIAERLGLAPDAWLVTFQSRLGRARWLEPYTEPSLVALAKAGVGSVDVVCPGFVADNLETLEEIDIEARAAFMKAGGKRMRFVPCLNDAPAFICALSDLARRHLAGWPCERLDRPSAAARDAELDARRQRAKAAGAVD
ncbi:MAG: ferrochelatase [Lautropia sp.]